MDSEPTAPAVSLTPAQGTPQSPSSSGDVGVDGGGGGGGGTPHLIRAPLSPPEENDFPKTFSSSSDTASDTFLSGEDEPEFETASEMPFVDENLELDPESQDSAAGSNGDSPPNLLLPNKPAAAMPKAQPSEEGDDDVTEEVVDEGSVVGEVEGLPPPPLPHAARVTLDQGVGSPGSVSGDVGVLEEAGDNKEKEPASEIRVSEGPARGGVVVESAGGGSEVNLDDGDDGASGSQEKMAAKGESSVESAAQDGVSAEVSKEDTLPDNLVVDRSAATELSDSVGLGDGAVANEQYEKNVDLGAGGMEEATSHVTEVAGYSEPVEAESDVGVIEGVEEKGVSDVQYEKEVALGGGSEEATSPVAEAAAEAKPVEAEPYVPTDAGGATGGAGSDQKLESSTVPGVEPRELGFSETKESMGVTERRDESLDSSETKQSIGQIEKDEVLEGVAASVDSEEAENSTRMLENRVEKSEAVDGSVPSKLESKDEGDDLQRASAELEANSNEAEPKLDADDDAVKSVEEVELLALIAEDCKNEEADREVLGVSGAADNDGNARVISISDIELEHHADFSQAADGEENRDRNEVEEEEGMVSGRRAKVAILGSSETAKQIIRELEGGSSGTSSGFGSSRDFSHQIDGQVVSDSDEEVETDDEGDGKELFDSAALAALLKAATGASHDGNITINAPDAARIFSVDRPAGLGSSVPSLKPAPPRPTRPSLFSPSDLTVVGEQENMDEEEKKLQENVEQIRVKFLRLVHRLGHSPEDTVAAQVLYRLGLAEGIRRGRQTGRAFSLENAKKKALQVEEDGTEALDFSCNILVLGKTGVGKSATINSIFGEQKSRTNAFEPATTSVKEIVGTIDGVNIRVIDTPGLKPSVMDQAANRRILTSIQKYTKKCPPDIVLYVDRLDTQTRDFNDLPLLRSIASTLGSSIWFNAIVALTHAASAPPDGPNGSPLSYEVFIAQRSHVVQHSIRQAAGDMRLMNPVALVENHPSCRRNREGRRVLPNGLSWRPQMLLLCYSSKILSEANSLLKLQDPSPGKLFGFRVRSPPLPFLLSSLLQSRAHPKLATDQENGDSDIDLGDLSDSDQDDEEDEYDQLPPFKPLRKAQIVKLTKEQRKAYFDEYDYRVKLLQKKQWKEELRRLKEMKKRGKSGQPESSYGDMAAEDYDQDGAPAAVPVPLPDMVLPPSFDCDNPAYRYRFLEPTSQLLARPVLDTHGWDHDCGYDGVSLEENLAIAGRFPAGVTVQITKDKKEFNIHLDSSVSAKHGENGSSLAGFDIQSVGKQLAYIFRGETKFKNLKKNKTAAGISVTFLGENIATGLKVEDQVLIRKRVSLVASTGAVRAQGDVAYGANLEARLREKDFPVGQDLSTLGLSLMRWRGDLALGANLQSQFSVGRNSKMAVRVGLNNKLSGQITVRTSTSEQLQIALLGILPIAVSIYRSIWPGESY